MNNLLQLSEQTEKIEISVSENIETSTVKNGGKLLGILCILSAVLAFFTGGFSLLLNIVANFRNANSQVSNQPFGILELFTILFCAISIFLGLFGYYKLRAIFPTWYGKLSIIGAGLMVAMVFGSVFRAILLGNQGLSTRGSSFFWLLLLAFLFPIVTMISALGKRLSFWRKFAPLILPISVLSIFVGLPLSVYLPLVSIFAGLLGIATFTEAKSAEQKYL